MYVIMIIRVENITDEPQYTQGFMAINNPPPLSGSARLSTGVYLLHKFRPGRRCVGYTVWPR